jgi:hypothetical protein
MPRRVVWQKNLPSGNSTSTGYNYRFVIPASQQIAGTGGKVRLRFKTYSKTFSKRIFGVSIGERDGSTAGFSGSPTRVTFDGGEEGFDTAWDYEDYYSDWIDYNWDETKDHLIHIYAPTGAGYQYVAVTGGGYRKTTQANETMEVSSSGYTAWNNNAFVVEIETWDDFGEFDSPREYVDIFSGESLSVWTERPIQAAASNKIETSDECYANTYLYRYGTSSVNRTLITLDAIGPCRDVEILSKYRIENNFLADVFGPGFVVRHQTGEFNGIFLAPFRSYDSLYDPDVVTRKCFGLGDVWTLYGSSPVYIQKRDHRNTSWALGSYIQGYSRKWLMIRFRVSGEWVRAKFWSEDQREPDGWCIELRTYKNNEGYVGLMDRSGGYFNVDFFSVAVGGDTAPWPTTGDEPNISTVSSAFIQVLSKESRVIELPSQDVNIQIEDVQVRTTQEVQWQWVIT